LFTTIAGNQFTILKRIDIGILENPG